MADLPDRPRIPFVADITTRDSTLAKDAKVINGYVEKRLDGGYDFFKRPGLTVFSDRANATGRGVFNWLGDIYAVWNGTLYKNNVAIAGAISDTSIYSFVHNVIGTQKLFFKVPAAAYTYDSVNGIVQVVDVDYPNVTVQGAAFLDSTIYVMTPKGEIYGSGLNDGHSWDPLNKIVAQSEPDAGIAITKHLSYVVALKEWSTEFFYDAGNPTGSPLARLDQLKLPYGCVEAFTVAGLEDNLFWASKNRSGGVCVVHLSRDMKSSIVSTPPIDRVLQTADFSSASAQAFKFAGHRLYVLSIPLSNISLVYDQTEGVWYQWSGVGLGWFGMRAVTFSGQDVLLQHSTDGDIYTLTASSFKDADHGVFSVELITPIWDGGTTKAKTVTLLEVIGDKVSGNSIQIRHTDDDYQNWVPFRTVDLSLGRARLGNLGTFYRRAYHAKHQLEKPLRLQWFEHQMALGSL